MTEAATERVKAAERDDGARVLLLHPRYARVWRRVLPGTRISVLAAPEEPLSLEPPAAPADPERILDIAQSHADRFDFVIGECTETGVRSRPARPSR